MLVRATQETTGDRRRGLLRPIGTECINVVTCRGGATTYYGGAGNWSDGALTGCDVIGSICAGGDGDPRGRQENGRATRTTLAEQL